MNKEPDGRFNVYIENKSYCVGFLRRWMCMKEFVKIKSFMTASQNIFGNLTYLKSKVENKRIAVLWSKIKRWPPHPIFYILFMDGLYLKSPTSVFIFMMSTRRKTSVSRQNLTLCSHQLFVQLKGHQEKLPFKLLWQ